MSERHAKRGSVRHLTFHALLGTLLIAPVLSPPPAAAQDTSCAAAETLAPGSVLRRNYLTPPAETDLVRVPVSEPGVLELYLSAGVRTATPRISFLGLGCGSPKGEDAWERIRETPRELHLMIREPGDYVAAVSSEIPGAPLADYLLHASFAAERPVPDEVIALDANPPADCRTADLPTFSPEPFADSRLVVVRRDGFTKDVDPWDDDGILGLTTEPDFNKDVDPWDDDGILGLTAENDFNKDVDPWDDDGILGLTAESDFNKDVDPWDDDGILGLTAEPGVLLIEAPDTALDAALHDGDDCTLERRVAEGALGGAGAFVAAPVHAGAKRLLLAPSSGFDLRYEIYVRHYALCADAAADDHPDRPLCATALAPGLDLTGVVAGDGDEDHFTFTLAGQHTVAIDLAGGDGVRAVLHDHHGQRLDAWDPGVLVRTLGAGRFYVLVAGTGGWAGEYGVRMRTLP